MSKNVSFTAMLDGTKADYDLTSEHDAKIVAGTAGRVIESLKLLDGDSPYQISRLA